MEATIFVLALIASWEMICRIQLEARVKVLENRLRPMHEREDEEAYSHDSWSRS